MTFLSSVIIRRISFVTAIVLSSSSTIFFSAVDIRDVTKGDVFESLIENREEKPWAVLFIDADKQPVKIPSFWKAAAKTTDEKIVGFAYVDCSKLSSLNGEKTGFADSNCVDAKKRRTTLLGASSSGRKDKKDKKKNSVGYSVVGYTFDPQSGNNKKTISFWWTKTVAEPPLQGKKGLNKWLVSSGDVANGGTGMLPNLVVELTAAQGTNVLHKEYFGNFLKYEAGSVNKALFFTTTSAKNKEVPVLVRSLAIKYRQRILIGEVKASDTTLRAAFKVDSPPGLVIVQAGDGKRIPYYNKGGKSSFKRDPLEKFLDKYKNEMLLPELHSEFKAMSSDLRSATQNVKVKKQSYSNADSADIRNFPRGFNPWKSLELKPSKSIPKVDVLKNAYRDMGKKYHPDKCQSKKKGDCEKKMAEVSLANDVLSDARKLQQWEAWREDTLSGTKRKQEL